MPIPGLIATFGMVFLGVGADAEAIAPSAASRSKPAVAIDVPVRSGFAAFEVPPELSDHEIFFIVSARTIEGTFAGRWSMNPGTEGGKLPDLRTIGPRIPIDNVPLQTPRVRTQWSTVALDAGRSTIPERPRLRRVFSVLVRPGDPRSPSNYDLVDAQLRAVGERIQVFVDDDDTEVVGDEVLRSIVSSFDRVIEPRISAHLGPVLDVDRDGRFTVLISRRIGIPFHDRSHVDGYFRSADLDHELPRPLSNRADMIYLSAELKPGPYLETVLAHEYAHAVLESRRREHHGHVVEESWLDEAMAHLCEDLVGLSTLNFDYRVSAYLSDPGRYRVIVDDEHRPGRFRSHGNRGASYLFLRWCAETIAPDLLLRLCTQADVGRANLERATGLSFEELSRRWAIAMTLASIGQSPADSTSLDLLDSIGDWPLSGLRFTMIESERSEVPFALEGSGSQFFRLSVPASGTAHVALQTDPNASAQVTALLIPTRLPRVSLELSVLERGPESSTLMARITEQAGLRTSLDRFSWEPLTPSPERSRSELQFQVLNGDELRSIFPETTIAPGETLTSLPFRLSNDLIRSAPLIFRLTTQSTTGHCSVSWSELPVLAPPSRSTRSVSLERPPTTPLIPQTPTPP